MPDTHQIKIVRKNNRVTFDPRVLDVNVRDQIYWTNTDNKPHWPGMPNDKTFFMSYQIAPGTSSTTFAPGLGETLDYGCSLHLDENGDPVETGTIVVTDPTKDPKDDKDDPKDEPKP